MEQVSLNGTNEIIQFILKYNKISSDYIVENLKNSIKITLQFDNGNLMGVVVIKKLSADRINNLSKLSNTKLYPDYNELGYLVVHPDYQHKGLGYKLVSSILNNYTGKLLATTGCEYAERILIKYGFKIIGTAWCSVIDKDKVIKLYVRE